MSNSTVKYTFIVPINGGDDPEFAIVQISSSTGVQNITLPFEEAARLVERMSGE